MLKVCRFLLSFCLAGVCAPAFVAAAPADVSVLTAELAGLLEKEEIPGAGIALLRDHQVLWVGGIGDADVAAKTPVAADTPFMVGSVSKSFTALAVMTLVEAGKIDLDAPIKRYLPDSPIDNPWESTHPVTVAQVLEHTAGFDDLHFRNFATEVVDLPVAAGVRGNAVSYGVRWPPGERFSYSNPGYLLAGELIERVSGQDFDSYVEQHVLRPLGMAQASYRFSKGMPIAQGYADDGSPEPFPLMPDRPAGALHASANEMALFVAAMMQREVPFLSAASLKRIETPMTSAAARAGLTSGYGLANHNREISGFSLRRHTGGVPGFSSYYAYEPERGFGFVVLINRMAAPKSVTDAIVKFLVKDIAPPVRPSIAVVPATLTEHVGYYRPGNPRFSLFRFADALLGVIEIAAAGDGLIAKPLVGESQKLVAVAGSAGVPAGIRSRADKDVGAPSRPPPGAQFRVDEELLATYAFARDASGQRLLLTDDGYLRPVSAWSAWWPLVVVVAVLLSGVVAIFALVGAAMAAIFALVRRRPGSKDRGHGRIPARNTLRAFRAARRCATQALLFTHESGSHNSLLRVLPLLAILCLGAHVILFDALSIEALGRIGIGSVALYATQLGFAVASVATVFVLLRRWRNQMSRFVRWHSLASGVSGCVFAAWLAAYGYLGTSTWAW